MLFSDKLLIEMTIMDPGKFQLSKLICIYFSSVEQNLHSNKFVIIILLKTFFKFIFKLNVTVKFNYE